MKTKFFLSVLACLVYLGSFGQNDLISAKQFMDMTKADNNMVIIDASKASSYKTSHIKGAVNIPHTTLYKSGDIEGLIKSPEELAKFFGSKGISDKNTIVLYDGGSQKYSTRVYWVFKYLGAKNVKILHKDMNQWKKVRVPLTRMPAAAKPTTFTANVDKSVYVDMAYVKTNLANDNVKIVDARTKAEFNGTSDNPTSDGHIPGAINLDHKDLLTDSEAFKTKDAIAAVAAQAGISAGNEIILYCRTSVRGAVLYVAFKEILGYSNVKIYDGAYTEWATKYDFEK